jgi:hypothetical protein
VGLEVNLGFGPDKWFGLSQSVYAGGYYEVVLNYLRTADYEKARIEDAAQTAEELKRAIETQQGSATFNMDDIFGEMMRQQYLVGLEYPSQIFREQLAAQLMLFPSHQPLVQTRRSN